MVIMVKVIILYPDDMKSNNNRVQILSLILSTLLYTPQIKECHLSIYLIKC